MLKPRDIINVEFRPAFRGYNRDDVDEFVRKIVSSYEELYQENLRLTERIGELQQRIEEYSQTEAQIDETLALARQTAADVKGAAEDRASTIVTEAKIQAEDIVRSARRQVDDHLSRAQELTRQERAFRERFRDLLEAYWALLEEERRDAEQLTQSIMAVAGQVAVAQEPATDDGGETADASLGYGLGDDQFDDDVLDEYTEYIDSDAQPTRRMDAIDGGTERI